MQILDGWVDPSWRTGAPQPNYKRNALYQMHKSAIQSWIGERKIHSQKFNCTMKYKLTENKKTNARGVVLTQIEALRDFANVKKGDLGGWVESDVNIAQSDNSWVYCRAEVFGQARVYGNARVCESAQVYGDTRVFGDARVYGSAQVSGSALVFGDAQVFGSALVSGSAQVFGSSYVGATSVVTLTSNLLNVPNLRYNLTIVPGYVFGGCKTFTHKEFKELTLDKCEDKNWTQRELDVYKSFLSNWEGMQNT